MTDLTAETINRIVELGGSGTIEHLPNGNKGFIIPSGCKLVEVLPTDPDISNFIDQGVKVFDEASFVAYLDDYSSDKTRIFAAPSFLSSSRGAYFLAVIDYHEKDKPNRTQHELYYSPRHSDEWKLWVTKSREAMDQHAFAEFIEENRQDIKDPSAAELLDLVRNFKASRKIEYDKTFTDKDGNTKLTYEDETEAKGEIQVPDVIKVGIPVYFNGPKYEVELWVRYRVGTGKVQFHLKPDRADIIEMHAFDEMAARIASEASVTIYLGWAENRAKSDSPRYDD